MPKVYNLITERKFIPSDAILCDRKTKYGNPFVVGIHGSRDEVCNKYDEWINLPEQKFLKLDIEENLKGKDLICRCYPKRCHCYIIRRIAN